MITKSDWQAVNRQLMADDRRRLGEPPTAEEILAYSRGELPAEEEARVRERLACHPELARTLTEPFPTEGARPGDPDYLTDEEFAFHWPALRTKPHRTAEGGRVLRFWRFAAAIAASIAVVLGASLWQANLRVRAPRIVAEQQLLLPDGARGGGSEATPLSAHGESVVLVVPLIGQRDYQRYRLELVNLETRRPMWTSAALAPRDDETFTILLPRSFLKPGRYQVVVYGIIGAAQEQLSTYSLRVPPSRS